MSELVNTSQLDPVVIESIVTKGDLSALSERQLVSYYNYRCGQVGLDPSAKPFDVLVLSGKKVLYANASATQQLSSVHGLSTAITNRERIESIYCVSARVTGKDGRSTENQGAVDIANLSGEKLANAIMKATTKAIRRTVLAHCGLGMLDETELETIPAQQMQKVDLPPLQTVLEGKHKLLIPDGNQTRVHSSFDDEEEWQAGFFGMIGRIASSTKLDTEAKNAKLRELFRVNEPVYGAFVGHEASEFSRRVAESDCEQHLPKEEALVVEV